MKEVSRRMFFKQAGTAAAVAAVATSVAVGPLGAAGAVAGAAETPKAADISPQDDLRAGEHLVARVKNARTGEINLFIGQQGSHHPRPQGRRPSHSRSSLGRYRPMSSHREAPEISKDPVADSTDLYAFISPDKPDTVTLIANYIPLESPAGGPNFYEFGDDVLYEIHIDNNGDGYADVTYQFNFEP